MGRTRTKSSDVEIITVRQKIRELLLEKYGGVVSFLETPQGKKLGGMKVRVYLYDTGPVNYKVLADFCRYLGIGTLTRTVKRICITTYQLNTSTADEKVS